ncbi:HPR3B [Auxenochlorella protothecoides x Auxenochlorella symbiontica]
MAIDKESEGKDYEVLLWSDFGGPDFLATWRRELENAGLTIVEAKLGVDLEKVRYVVCFNPPDGLLAQCPNLRLIHSMGAGITHRMLRDEVCPTHVPMVRVVDPLMAQRMATFCMWAVINVQRKCDAYLEAQNDCRWDKSVENFTIRDNSSVRVGILGLGNLGAATATLLLAAGYPVSAWTRSARANDQKNARISYYHDREGLFELAREAQILICLLPLTDETAGLLDARLFATLPPGAAIINVARGGHVVDVDLIQALDSGHLSAAVLDVFHEEPLPKISPLWTHPRVRVFPHVSSVTQRQEAVRQMKENFDSMDAGTDIPRDRFIVRSRGY